MFVKITDITVPDSRQRKDLGELDGLKNSLQEIGQLVPIIVDKNEDGKFILIAGERRLTAAKQLNWNEIEVKLREELSPRERTYIELEENIRRKQLAWTEEVRAVRMFANIAKEPIASVAKSLGMPAETVSKMITTADAIDADPKLEACPNFSSAYNQYQIRKNRELDAAFEDIRLNLEPADKLDDPIEETKTTSSDGEVEITQISPPRTPIQDDHHAENEDFALWVKHYEGKRFNLIHCDFPYGINVGDTRMQNASYRWETVDERYEDSPETFDRLVRSFFENQDRFIADSAHCIFWTAHKNYGKIASRFNYYGWAVCEVPLIWHKSNHMGMAPDPYRWPRRTYEIAIFASRGDRKILKVKDASCVIASTKEYHFSEKPLEMLTHFFEMVCDHHTELLDPTCGSGTALRVAKKLGAKRTLGLDINPAHVEYVNKGLGAN